MHRRNQLYRYSDGFIAYLATKLETGKIVMLCMTRIPKKNDENRGGVLQWHQVLAYRMEHSIEDAPIC